MSDKNADSFMMIEGLPESVGTEESVFEKEIWNRAIEAAAQVMFYEADKINIRSLKK